MKLINKFLGNSKFLNQARDVAAVFSLKDPKGFLKVFHKHLRQIVVYASGLTRVANRLRHFEKFAVLVLRTYSHHGSLYTVKWLKASHTAIQRYLAGVPYKTLREIEPDLPLPRLINGLPAFIGSMDRAEIRRGFTPTIRLWLSILSIYRVLDAPVKAKLNTITDSWEGSRSEIDLFSAWFFSYLSETEPYSLLKEGVNIKRLKADSLRLSVQGGPNISPAYAGVLTDSLSVFRYKNVAEAIREYCSVTCSSLWDLLVKTKEIALERYRNHDGDQLWMPKVSDPSAVDIKTFSKKGKGPVKVKGTFTDIYPGKLLGLPEPAGKLRVIALVDVWTQSLLKPLHDTLFGILARLPNDGTFNQELSVHRSKSKAMDTGTVYSVDLSAATDRLPIELQEWILNALFGNKIGTLWKGILNRPFVLREKIGEDTYDGQVLWYGTGQPMGCLSSWAMLALTHHCILQYCARNITNHKGWATCYEILGDDLVIFDKTVYQEYIRFMDAICVGTNPHKSLVSETSQTFEFAKRTVIKGVDVSGLSWKQFISATGIKDRLSLIFYLVERGLLYRDGLLTRLIESNLYSRKLKDTEVSRGLLLSLLGHLALKGKISWENAIAYILDPSKGEASALEGALPIKITVHDVLTLLQDLYFNKDLGQVHPSELTLPKVDQRIELGANEVIPYLGNSIFRSTMARLFSYEQEYELIPNQFRSELITHFWSDVDLSSLSPCDHKLYDLIDELALNLLYRGNSDQAVFDMALDYIRKLEKSPELSVAMEFRDKLEAYVSRFAFLKGDRKGPLKETTKTWLQADLVDASIISEKSLYYRVINPVRKPKVTKWTKVPIVNRDWDPDQIPLEALLSSARYYDKDGKPINRDGSPIRQP